MFEPTSERRTLSTADLAVVAAHLRAMPAAGDESEHVDRIRLLEELKAVSAAAQARETAALHAARRDAEAARGRPRSAAAAWRPRSPSPAGTPPLAARVTSAWRSPWSIRCRTRWPP
jgi:hypothetical protein